MEVAYSADKAGAGQGTAKISSLNVAQPLDKALAIKELVVLHAEDYVADSHLPFGLQQISNDGRFLYVFGLEQTAKETYSRFLRAVDLSNGQVSTLVRLQSEHGRLAGLDWRDEAGRLQP